MNIFYIPSWHKAPGNPLTGIIFLEQAKAITEQYPSVNMGISSWGQNDDRYLLWAKQPIRSFFKLITYSSKPSSEERVRDNLYEYFSPALTWSGKILKGNLDGIVEANEKNLQQFERRFGKVSLIHAQVAFPAGYIAMKLAEKHKVNYIITEQMSPFPLKFYVDFCGTPLKKVSLPLQQSFKNIAISPQLARDMSEKVKIPLPVYIPNVVDEDFFYPVEQQPNDKFVFFTLAKMVPQKGIDILLAAIRQIIRIEKNVKFIIGGDGEEWADYKRLADNLKISSFITWKGKLNREQAKNEFQQCDAFVLPSRHESMGVVVAEAIACGKPVIATICGGPESIINATNGLLIQPGNPDELAQKMNWLMHNRQQYGSREIREDFEAKFSKKIVTRQILEVYKATLSH